MNGLLNIELEKQPEGDLLGRPLLSTVRKVDTHAECLGVNSFRSSSPQRAEEPLEVEGYGLRRFGRAANYFHSSGGNRPGERPCNPSRIKEKQG